MPALSSGLLLKTFAVGPDGPGPIDLSPESPTLLLTVLLQPVMLLLAWALGLLTQRLVRHWHARLSTSAATLTALVGLWTGLAVGAWLYSEDFLWAPRLLVSAVAATALTIMVTAFVVTRVQHEPPLPPIREVAARGESDQLELKSSARVNMHTGKKDDAMETIVAKTVCAFLNSRGGTLLLGVDDDGRLIGLGPDYDTLRTPDADRFELFLRDLWRTRLGTNAAALPRLDFAPADGPDASSEGSRRADGGGRSKSDHDSERDSDRDTGAGNSGEVCRVTVPPSPDPVYLLGPKGRGPRELWVRVGNSTRRLEVDDAVTYVSQRWPRVVRPTLRSRLGSYLLYHRRRAEPRHRPGQA